MNWDDYFPYFKPNEFTCKCGCGLNNMTDTHMDMLYKARIRAGIPFIINSGTRCTEHNEDIGGKETSDHLPGHGSDIKALSARERFLMVEALLFAGFSRIGIYPTFIHAGSRKDNPQDVLWHGSYNSPPPGVESYEQRR